MFYQNIDLWVICGQSKLKSRVWNYFEKQARGETESSNHNLRIARSISMRKNGKLGLALEVFREMRILWWKNKNSCNGKHIDKWVCKLYKLNL